MDKYDEAIDFLKSRPTADDFYVAVMNAWHFPNNEPGGALFQFITEDGETKGWIDEEGGFQRCGCLTEIKAGHRIATSTDLTNRIFADPRIPVNAHSIERNDLEVFAEWQRIVDKELRDPWKLSQSSEIETEG